MPGRFDGPRRSSRGAPEWTVWGRALAYHAGMKVSRLAASAVLFAAASLFGGCGAAKSLQQTAADSFHTSFRSSFKTSFMKSCTSAGAPEQRCDCVEATLERDYTDDQLVKMSANSSEAEQKLADAARACAAKPSHTPAAQPHAQAPVTGVGLTAEFSKLTSKTLSGGV